MTDLDAEDEVARAVYAGLGFPRRRDMAELHPGVRKWESLARLPALYAPIIRRPAAEITITVPAHGGRLEVIGDATT